MENAKGEFLTFLDSDDLMYPENLEDAAQYIKSNPATKLFHNLYQLVDEENRVLCKYDFEPLVDPLLAITRGNFLSCIGDFIHRDIYQNYKFDTNSIALGVEDWDFWLRVMTAYKPGRIEKVNNGVVHHGLRSINKLDLDKLHGIHAYLINKMANDPTLSSVYGKYLKRFEAGSLLYRSTFANLTCRHNEALRCLGRAVFLDFRLARSVSFMKALGIALLRWNKGY